LCIEKATTTTTTKRDRVKEMERQINNLFNNILVCGAKIKSNMEHIRFLFSFFLLLVLVVVLLLILRFQNILYFDMSELS